ncbi:MAG: amino acid ABC transporter permease [Anaerolineae bacterium]|nr:amino acid ABC transporter permease [Thermoflexales bacterium]MDW8407794.1 amino acid ABC transporter permease [Anaerolineae bacterium]
MAAVSSTTTPSSVQGNFVERLARLPWWLLLLILAGVTLLYQFLTNELYTVILDKLTRGIATTIFVTLISFSIAILVGLLAGLGRVSKNPIIYNLATLYVQVIRGLPILVWIFYVAFVLTPAFFSFVNGLGDLLAPLLGPDNFLTQASTQDVTLLGRAVIALAFAYGGYEAETFRAGIQSISRGQMEAARSLGMSYLQAMRYIILPQAVRRVLPPLGNDFIAMLKDSSLVSVLGVRDITQEARLYVAASFRYPETYNTLAFMYLSMTIVLSLIVKGVEARLGKDGRGTS